MTPQGAAILAGLLSLVTLLLLPVEPDPESHEHPELTVDLLMVLPWV